MTININGITKRFGETDVLRGIQLGVGKGELVSLLGPSGSGKTTLLKIIAGLVWPDSGRLEVDGADWLRLAARDRRIGFVFQHYALFPHMKVRENIAFGLRVRPRSERPGNGVIDARVAELMEFLQISELSDRYPTQLSGGQRQRVALGRALAIDPKVLLLDEPFGALDASIRRDLRRWLREVHEATGSTTIFVTHDQEEAFEIADRVVVMGEGRIEQIGHADEIHDHPATPFVARFMGATIELPVRLHTGRAEGADLDLGLLPRRALPDGEARLFARPEDIVPAFDAKSTWRIVNRTSNGTRFRFVVQHPELGEVEADVPRRVMQAASMPPGTPVRLRIEVGTIFPSERRPLSAQTSIITADPVRLEILR